MSYAVGDKLPPFVVESVDTEAMKKWAVYLADPNPIHLDPEVVKAKGLGDRVINQGPINVAYMMNCLLKAFPGGRIENMTSRFLDNVYGGEKVVAKGTIETVDEDRITCSVQLESLERGLVNSATATVILPAVQKSLQRKDRAVPPVSEPGDYPGIAMNNWPLLWFAWMLYPRA